MDEISLTRKRKNVSLQTKLQIIREIESGRSRKDISDHFVLPLSTIGSIWCNRKKITRVTVSGEMSPARKRIRTCANPEVDEGLLAWLKAARDETIPVKGPILQQMANEIASKLGLKNFHADKNWIDRFKQRHNIMIRTASDKGAVVCETTMVDWESKFLPEILKSYEPRNVFNADEIGLFFKMLPNTTLQIKGERCHLGTKSKERLTILVCTNMDGSEKVKLLVIGKFKNPHCFKNVKSLPVDYHANKRAWMTAEIFTEWVSRFNKKMKSQCRNVLLLVDNCNAHPKTLCDKFSNVKVAFFPPETTSLMQPLCQGIIFKLKSMYRRDVIQSYFLSTDKQIECEINVLSAINMIYHAWSDVPTEFVANCFAKAGFGEQTDVITINDDDDDDNDDVPLATMREVLLLLGSGDNDVDFSDYVNCDSDLVTSTISKIDDIVYDIRDRQKPTDVSATGSDEEDEDSVPPIVPGVIEVLDSIEDIRLYLQAQSDTPDIIFEHLHAIGKHISSN